MKTKRPVAQPGTIITTPAALTWLQLLGAGVTVGSVTLTSSEFNAVRKLYGFTAEKPNKKPKPPVAPDRTKFKSDLDYRDAMRDHESAVDKHDRWVDPLPIMQAGADRNAVRHAETDGLRLVAYLARFVPAGSDPVKTLVQALAEAGFDVPCEDIEWADSDDDETSVEATPVQAAHQDTRLSS